MALISCPECKADVSDQATACIHCGYPFAKIAEEAAAKARSERLLIGNPEHDRGASKEHGGLLEGNPTYSTASGSDFGHGQHAPGPRIVKTAKSRGVYIILGLFLGLLGVHNFYAGYNGRGLAQLLIALTLGWLIIGLVVVAVWVIIDLFTVSTDAAGDHMV